MVSIRRCAVGGLVSAAGLAHATFTAGVTFTVQLPALGAVDMANGGSTTAPGPIVGQVQGLPGGPGLYKGLVFFYGQCGIWWDKGHNAYNGQPNQGIAQNPMVVLSDAGEFTIGGYYKTSDYDVLSPVIAVFIVPATKDLTWPGYSSENIPIRDDIWIDAVAWTFIDRRGCTVAPGSPCTTATGALMYTAAMPVFPQVLEYPAGAGNAAGICPDSGDTPGARGAAPGIPYPAGLNGYILPGGPVSQEVTLALMNAAPSASATATALPAPSDVPTTTTPTPSATPVLETGADAEDGVLSTPAPSHSVTPSAPALRGASSDGIRLAPAVTVAAALITAVLLVAVRQDRY